ncbi:MAG: glycosyltransferase [SAR324 cluster bacterium]|nr:glycosyltransferase [SAR324 cluster bacterium]
MPRVSVILPSYNRSQSIGLAVESVLKQSFRDFELFVVDDGSEDDTVEILDSIPGSFNTLRLKENAGVSHARNCGIRSTDSEWIAFLDSDDVWHPQKLEKQIAYASERPEYLLHFTDEIWFRNGKRINPKLRHQKREGWIFQPSLELCLMAPSTVMLKRELLEQCGLFDEELPVCEDYDLWLRITAHHQVSFLNEALMTRSGGHADQLSRKYWGMDRFRVQSLKKILANVPLRKEDEMATRRVLKKKCEILLNGFRKRGKTEEISYYESLIKTYC